ncbi:MAG: lipoprotein [Gammaproteobacteria bacterium]|nr:lipoprotein [Gammaproteobacteria bacterium]
MKKFLAINLIVILLFLFTACGQKGPLYLPEKQLPAKHSARSV